MIDSHVHLDDSAFDEDRDSLIKSLGDNGIELVINNSSDLPSSERSVELATNTKIFMQPLESTLMRQRLTMTRWKRD